MARLLAACGGFLLAVLWMDLMFDVQARRLGRGDGPGDEDALGSIAAYYRRVTTDAFPMNRLIAAVMVITIAGSVWQTLHRAHGSPLLLVAPLLAIGSIALAGLRVVPTAIQLGRRSSSLAAQATLARAILRDHLVCAVGIAAFVLLQVSQG
jgi:hypothetical protein